MFTAAPYKPPTLVTQLAKWARAAHVGRHCWFDSLLLKQGLMQDRQLNAAPGISTVNVFLQILNCYFRSVPPDWVKDLNIGFASSNTHTSITKLELQLRNSLKWQKKNLLTARRCLHGSSGAHPSILPRRMHRTASSSPHLTAPGKGMQANKTFIHSSTGLNIALKGSSPAPFTGGEAAMLYITEALARTCVLD